MRRNVERRVVGIAAACAALLLAHAARAHCEIPCGIYGDRMRVQMLREHIQTVEKSMQEVNRLGGADEKDDNQLVRWVTNKELHANWIQEIVYQYFMNQRIVPVAEDSGDAYAAYVKRLTLLHGMLVQAMKCKQTTDAQPVQALRSLVDEFEKVYFDNAGHDHE